MPAYIIFAEDDEANAELIVEIIQILGHHSHRARNGLEVLTLVENQIPDLILLDMEMPVLDGVEALQRLRRDPRLQHTPIVGMSGNLLRTRQDYLNLGFTDFLHKPFGLAEMRQSLAGVLSQP